MPLLALRALLGLFLISKVLGQNQGGILEALRDRNAPEQNQGGVLEAIRERTCNNNALPAPPRNLYLTAADGGLSAEWWPPSNRPCDVRYEVMIISDGKVVTSAEVAETKATLTGLRNGANYKVLVAARSAKGKGPSIEATATPKGSNAWSSSLNDIKLGDHPAVRESLAKESRAMPGWTCVPEKAAPTCAAAASQLCNAMNCAEIAQRGLCPSNAVKKTDWSDRKVTQHCTAECGCVAAPALRTSFRAAPADACCSIQTGEYWKTEDGRPTNGLDL